MLVYVDEILIEFRKQRAEIHPMGGAGLYIL
jgi:hypothetical protein